jgi:uncharacterized protein YndB with AHSA1/START domain
MSTHSVSTTPAFTLTYTFSAPKDLVFNAFGTAEALNEWWGPVESRNTVIQLDFKPGGIFHFKMEFPAFTTYGRFLFGRIQPYDLLEFTNAFADEKANVIQAPFDIPFPREIFYRLDFTEQNGQTTIHLTGLPVDASDEETKGFLSINTSMQQGFGATFDKLSNYLDKQKHQ